MRFIKKLIISFILLIPVISYAELSLIECDESKIKGIFNLIIYSNSFINDPETFIILDKSDDSIDIQPYAPSFKFRIFSNINDAQALNIIKEIFQNSSVTSIKYKEIIESGKIVGYEIKPIYFPWVFGILEPIETVYKKQNNSIIIFIRLNPIVEKQLYNGGNYKRDN